MGPVCAATGPIVVFQGNSFESYIPHDNSVVGNRVQTFGKCARLVGTRLLGGGNRLGAIVWTNKRACCTNSPSNKGCRLVAVQVPESLTWYRDVDAALWSDR